MNMKRRIITAAAGLTLLTSATIVWSTDASASARGRSFSNADLSGSYGLIERGWLAGMNWSEVGVVTADGHGNLDIDFVGTLGGTTNVEGTVACSYDVRANGMGSMECEQDGAPDFGVNFVLAQRGHRLNFITTPTAGGGQSMGTAIRQ